MSYEPDSRKAENRVKRLTDRAAYDQETIFDILDSANGICHITFKLPVDPEGPIDDDFPVILPMVFGRIEDTLYLHGHFSTRLLKALSSEGVKACVSVTRVFGYKIAMSPFHSSIYYSSAVLFGMPYECKGEEKAKGMTCFTNELFRSSEYDRWEDSRLPTEAEIKTTTVVALPIESASAKRSPEIVGDDKDDKEKFGDKYWSGVVLQKESFSEVKTMPWSKVAVPAAVANLVQA